MFSAEFLKISSLQQQQKKWIVLSDSACRYLLKQICFWSWYGVTLFFQLVLISAAVYVTDYFLLCGHGTGSTETCTFWRFLCPQLIPCESWGWAAVTAGSLGDARTFSLHVSECSLDSELFVYDIVKANWEKITFSGLFILFCFTLQYLIPEKNKN